MPSLAMIWMLPWEPRSRVGRKLKCPLFVARDMSGLRPREISKRICTAGKCGKNQLVMWAGNTNLPIGLPGGVPLLAGNHFELLHSAAVNRLTHINVALGVHRHRVRVHEFAQLVAGTAKAAEHLSGGAVRDIDFLVDFIDHVHVLLSRIP